MEDIATIRRRAQTALGTFFSMDHIALCLSYEVGDLTRAVYRMGYCASEDRRDERTKRAYHAEAKLAVADASLQLRLMVNQLGLVWEDVVKLGEDHHRETMSQLMQGERE